MPRHSEHCSQLTSLYFPQKYKLGKIVIKKSDGTTLYITRDIAAAIWRHRTYGFEKMFYVVGSQQNLHFQQLFKILDLMGFDWAKKCNHINFGMITGMSTRKGTWSPPPTEH